MSLWLWWRAPEQHFLRWAVGLSLAFHVALISWVPREPIPVTPQAETLEMIIVSTQTEASPLDPKRLAQANLEGGGVAQDGVASNPSPQVGKSEQAIAIDAMTQQRAALESEQNALLEQLLKEWVVPVFLPQTNNQDNEPTPGNDSIDQAAMERNAEIAALVDRIERYNALPKRYYDAPSALAHPYVTYIDQWRQKIEETGRRFYPGDDNNRPAGSLQATVTIDSNGQVVDIALDRPSPLAILNQSVKRIVQLAAPFPPFPPNMRQKVDQIVVTRTWQFKAGQLTTTTEPTKP